jgi:hypothetical protein
MASFIIDKSDSTTWGNNSCSSAGKGGVSMGNYNFERVINLAAKDTKKGARVTAKVFYRMLRKNGFTENQVIDIATNILNCLTESLMGYEERVEKSKRKKSMTGTDKREKVSIDRTKLKNMDYNAQV